MAITNGDKIFIVISSCVEADNFQSPDISTKVFATGKEAREYLIKDYESCLKENSDEDAVLGVISSVNYGDSAEILVGEVDEENIDNSEVELAFNWQIQMKTIRFAD